MKNFVVRYGLIGASVSIVLGLFNWFFLAQSSEVGTSQIVGYLSIILSLMVIPLGIKYFRDKLNGGQVSFKESFKIGSGITLITAIIMSIYSILFFYFEGDEFKVWRESGMSAEQLEKVAEQPAYVDSILFQGLLMFFIVFLIGIIINLLSTLIFKKSDQATLTSS